MKKITFFLLLLLFSFQAIAQVLNQAASWPNTNWSITGTYVNGPTIFEANPTTSANFAYDDDDAGSGAINNIQAVSPVIDLTAAFNAGETWLFLNSTYVYNNIGADRLGVQYWNADTSTWINWGTPLAADTPGAPLDNFCNGASQPFNSGELNIAGFTPTQLAGFRYRIFYNDGGVWAWGFCFNSPTITSQTPPTCPVVTGLAVANITSTTANISWNAGNTETLWQIAIQPAGTGVPSGPGTSTPNNAPYNAMSLNPSTAYEVYVRADCGANGFSNWVGPINFTTLNTPPPPPNGVTCGSGSSSFIFTESFETDPPSGWTGNSFDGNNGNWDITAGNANSGGTGPFVSFNGGMHLEYEASGNATNIANAISPAIDLSTAVDGAELSFYMHAFGDDIGTLNVGISTSATGPFTNLYTWVGDYQTTANEAWVPIGINLDAYLGQVVYIRFSYGGAGTGFEGDLSIDYVRVETCGSFCIAPSGLTVANVGGTTADISWTANNGESAWEYVVQPAGTGAPTGSGNPVSSTTVNETTLNYSTAYEVYVRADCGGGNYSVWAGPVNFTTTVQTDFIVDCNVGPVNSVSCYDDSDPTPTVFTFTSSDGITPLNIVFNSGNVENNWDELIVLDSDGTTNLNAATPYGTAGNVAGITYQSTGPTISFYVDYDTIIDCTTSATINPLDVTVTCATCINPAATYAVIDDCDNGDQFLIDVNITSIGDATSLTISNNINANTVPVTATGTYQIGPFPFATPVIVTVSNDQDVNCVINSQPIQVLACPPSNDNCIDATVAAVNAGSTCDLITPGTVLAATPSGVPGGSCTGAPDDDVWFEFTALNEVQLISLINIAGGSTNLDHAVYSGSCGSLTELYCSPNTASVTPLLTVGNTYYVRVFSFGSTPTSTTFDLCIQKAPENTICEQAANFCGDGGPATGSNIIGFPSIGQIACLFTTPNPSWNIIQIGDPGLIEIQIDQVNGSGGGLDVDFVLWGPFDSDTDFCAAGVLDQGCPAPNNCPNNTSNPNFYPYGNIVDCSYSAAPTENLTIDNAQAGEIYVLLVTNFSNQAGTITITQTNAGNGGAGSTVAEIQVDLGEDQDFCGFPDYTIVADSPFADTYEWYYDGFIIDGETSSTLTVTETGIYTVFAYDTNCDAVATDEILVTFGTEPVANPVQDIITCDDASADGFEDFDLESQTPIVLGAQDPSLFNVTYHLTQSDANSNTGALSSPYINITNPQTIWIRIEDANATFCSVTTSFDLIISGPTPTATSVDIALCDDASRDGVESFDLTAHDANVLNGQSATDYSVSYYATQADADAGTSALTSPYTNTSNPQTIWARVESNIAVDCYSIIDFDLIVDDIPVTSFTSDFDYEVCPNATVPIMVEATANNYSVGEVTIDWYLDGTLITGQNGLVLPVLVEGTYTIDVTFNDTGCTSSTDIVIIELEQCVIPQGISPNNDGYNDFFDLSSFAVTKLEIFNRNGTLVYSKTNYTNEWYGQTNNGDELPVGTYYYTMEYENGKTKSAWVYINK